MTRQPDPMDAIRAAAPASYNWLCTCSFGVSYLQTSRGSGPFWSAPRQRIRVLSTDADKIALSAIHLPTGTVHLQKPDGSIIEVTRKEWDV